MHVYIATMFWVGVIGVILRAANLIADHPRPQKPVNIGTDVFSFIVSVLLLACVSILYFGNVS